MAARVEVAWAALLASFECMSSWFSAQSCTTQSVVAASAAFLAYVVTMWTIRIYETRAIVSPPVCKGFAEHGEDVARVLAQVQNFLANRKPGQAMSINRSRGGHSDSNRTIDALYKKTATRVDVSRLDTVICVDSVGKNGHPLMHIEPGLPMDEMARVALAHGFVPQVVLEFPGITAGGAICGGGIESSSHAWGCFFDTVEEVDIITGDGVYRQGVSRTNEPNLFAALGTTFGTNGVLTRIAVRLEKATKYVRVRYLHGDGMASGCNAMTSLANADSAPAFIDGVCLSPTSSMIVVGDYTETIDPEAPLRTLRQHRSDVWFFWHLTDLARKFPALKYDKANEKGAPKRSGEVLRASACASETVLLEDYLFRFDRGAFWMARHGLQVFWGNAAYRTDPSRPSGPDLWVRIKYSWLATTRQLYRMLHRIGDEMLARHYVVQDYIMPDSKAACELVKYTAKPHLDIWPLWLCPVRMVAPRHPCNPGFGFPVQATPEGGLMVNVGVYGFPNGYKNFDPLVTNKGLENEASRLGGRKMLYAQSFYSPEEFWSLFDKAAYEKIRKAYGGEGVFPAVDTKLLLGPRRLQAMSGIKQATFTTAAWGMFQWYLSLWGEALLPRFLHSPAIGIERTGMTAHAPYAPDAPSRMDGRTVSKELAMIKGQLQGSGNGKVQVARKETVLSSSPVAASTPRAASSGRKAPGSSARKRAGTKA